MYFLLDLTVTLRNPVTPPFPRVGPLYLPTYFSLQNSSLASSRSYSPLKSLQRQRSLTRWKGSVVMLFSAVRIRKLMLSSVGDNGGLL